MKKLTLVLLALTLGGLFLRAQSSMSERPSPPAETFKTVGDLDIRINYSQPGVKGRTIWGMLVPYGEVWRTGANEATTFAVNEDVLIEGKKLPAGKYSLFTIPDKGEWTIIFNEEPDQWGHYNYDAQKDALRVTVPASESETFTERMIFEIEEKGSAAGSVVLQWENLAVAFDVEKAQE